MGKGAGNNEAEKFTLSAGSSTGKKTRFVLIFTSRTKKSRKVSKGECSAQLHRGGQPTTDSGVQPKHCRKANEAAPARLWSVDRRRIRKRGGSERDDGGKKQPKNNKRGNAMIEERSYEKKNLGKGEERTLLPGVQGSCMEKNLDEAAKSSDGTTRMSGENEWLRFFVRRISAPPFFHHLRPDAGPRSTPLASLGGSFFLLVLFCDVCRSHFFFSFS